MLEDAELDAIDVAASRGTHASICRTAAQKGQLPALVRQPMLAGLDRMLLMEVMIHHVDTLRFLIGAMQLTGARLGRNCGAIQGTSSMKRLAPARRCRGNNVTGSRRRPFRPPHNSNQVQLWEYHSSV